MPFANLTIIGESVNDWVPSTHRFFEANDIAGLKDLAVSQDAGGAGADEPAAEVVKQADRMTLWNKVRAIAQNIHGADDIMADGKVVEKFRALEDQDFVRLPVCMAKTQSLTVPQVCCIEKDDL